MSSPAQVSEEAAPADLEVGLEHLPPIPPGKELDVKEVLESEEPWAVNDASVLQAVHEYEKEIGKWREELASKPKATRISPKLIADRCLPAGLNKGDDEAYAEAIIKVTHLNLENCNIHNLESLEPYSEATHGYFQGNQIEAIGDGFDFFHNLKLLILSRNAITKIEGFEDCYSLQVLDLSHNQIQTLDESALPATLRYLNLEGNPIPGYPEDDVIIKRIVTQLPHLIKLDNIHITNVMRLRYGLPMNPSDYAEDYNGLKEDFEEQVDAEEFIPNATASWNVFPTELPEPDATNADAANEDADRAEASQSKDEARPGQDQDNVSGGEESEIKVPASGPHKASASSSATQDPPSSTTKESLSGSAKKYGSRITADLALEQALSDVESQRARIADMYDRVSETMDNEDAEADQWMASRKASKASELGSEASLLSSAALTRMGSRPGSALGRPDSALLRPASVSSVRSSISTISLTASKQEEQKSIPTLHAEIVGLSNHRKNMGCVQINDDFDAGLAMMRAKKRAIIEASRERRRAMGMDYSERKEEFKKGNLKVGHKSLE